MASSTVSQHEQMNTSFVQWKNDYKHTKWYRCPKARLVALFLIESHQFKSGLYKRIYLEARQVLKSHKEIELNTGLSRQEIRTALAKLEAHGFLKIAAQQPPTKKGKLLTLIDYNTYDEREIVEQPRNQKYNLKNNLQVNQQKVTLTS